MAYKPSKDQQYSASGDEYSRKVKGIGSQARREAAIRADAEKKTKSWKMFCLTKPHARGCGDKKPPPKKAGVSHHGWDEGGPVRRSIGSDISPPPPTFSTPAVKVKVRKAKRQGGSWDDPIELG